MTSEKSVLEISVWDEGPAFAPKLRPGRIAWLCESDFFGDVPEEDLACVDF